MSNPDPLRKQRIQNAIDMKTKPPGSLGQIEKLALQMAIAQQTDKPVASPCHLLLFAGDHGLVEEGVSAWPSEVTTQMVMNFLSGGAAANVFARANGAEITVIDAGVIGDLPDHPELIRANIRKGTRNALKEDALTFDEVDAAIAFGSDTAKKTILERGARIIALGEMGIGNTSSAALLTHAIEGIPLDILAGPGAGLDADGVRNKLGILKLCAQRKPGKLSSRQALAAFGGLEITMMAGALLSAAEQNAVVLVDGFIATAAALCALRENPQAAENVVFAHKSEEPGHAAMLEVLDATALLDLNMRLGEGSGALLALPLLNSACAMLNEMATFESAGVSGKSED
ncbi:MAG: nicotinate-nucleotide--dimethylbenzimidazole phosphoribosyltransferase [Pseudomonadota bacterium]